MSACAASFAAARATYEMARIDALESVESDEELELLGIAQSTATEALITAAAPDLAALAFKLEVFAVEECFCLSPQYRDPLFGALAADAWRLAAEAIGVEPTPSQLREWKARRDVDRR